MVTFSDARTAVLAHISSTWDGTPGTPYVDPEGYADADDFLVVWGPEEYLVGGDSTYVLMNGTAIFVSRETGEIREVAYASNVDKINAMTPLPDQWTAAGAPLEAPRASPSLRGAWTATGDDWSLSWSPTAPHHLTGDSEVVGAVTAHLAERGELAVTPTGPFVPADLAEPLAVLGALVSLGYSFGVSGDFPRLPSVPDGAVA